MRTVIQARNYQSLNDAIRGARETEPHNPEVNLFHIRGHSKFRQGNSRGRFQRSQHQRARRGNFQTRPNRGLGNMNNSQNRYAFRNQGFRGRWQRRRYNNNAYFMNNPSERQEPHSSTSCPRSAPAETFFRGSTET